MRTRSLVLMGALGAAPFTPCFAVACSRTNPLDYESPPGPNQRGDSGARDGRSDASQLDGRPKADADADGRDQGPPEAGPPDVKRDVTLGCTSDAECDDGVACTVDHCDVATGNCSHEPVDTSCASGMGCFPATGCAPANFAQNFTTLYGAVLPAGTITTIGMPPPKFYDIALHPDGTLYGITEGALYTIDTTSAVSTFVAPVDRALVGLDFSGDGTLYGATGTSTEVYTIDPSSGALTVLANLPPSYACSGDVAVLGATIYVTAIQITSDGGTPPDVLVAIDLAVSPPTVTTVGSTGQQCVYGLAAYEGALYGFTCDGTVLGVDITTGSASVIAKHPGSTFYGAAAR